ncbi:TRAP-type C4-dicarboxylate transport system permease small subunit [Caldalkalibacillus uzonensis]|uniref:TRAP-type C4-dicarboxylate transport system permease small subunit n=1 Tax=Caldalkalibacillus uzonensis TaxID=353224 RepID=A0ABU0CY05_9BACI|nr:TRAP transporter small permease [Caldalkalibacillus uzonensis]MDQ0341027.1 TRAP-type C4-dicarboxylate transport system permease small subunit [Caldalkalibacillus uzonensis]
MEKKILFISKGLHYVAHLILLIMMFTVTVDVLGRFLINRPLLGSYEITQMGLALTVFFSLAYTHYVKEHITIDFVVEKFPPTVQKIFDIVISLVIAALMGVICWQLWESAQRFLKSNAVTGDLGIPVYIFYIMAMVGTVVFALVAFVNALALIQKEDYHNES